MAKPPSSRTDSSRPSASKESLSSADPKSTPKTKSSQPRKRDTLASLRQHVDEIFRRLKDADHMTQKSILSLETAFKILERRVGEDNTVNKAALTNRIDQLSEHLTGLISDTQKAVASDLKAVLANPSEARLKAAIESAQSRVTKAEMMQADSLTRINKHIADMAKAIDARFEQERQARDDAIQRIETKLDETLTRANQTLKATEAHVKAVEQSSAHAVTSLGERIANMSDEFTKRTDNNTKAIGAKISDIALKTQGDFEAFKTSLERRIENLEDNQRNLDSYTDRSLSNLSGRIDSLEYGLTTAAEALSRSPEDGYQTSELAPPPTPYAEDAFSPEPQFPDTNPHSAGTPVLTVVHDASTHDPYAPANNPETETYEPAAYQPREFVPMEFVPEGHNPLPSTPSYAPPPADEPLAYTTNSPIAPPPTGGPDLHDFAGPSPDVSPSPGNDFTMDDMPYENPAYAEVIDPAGVERPGAFKKIKPKKLRPKMPITGRNLKVAGFAIAVAAVGYFALRGFAGPSNGLDSGGGGQFVEDTSNPAPTRISRPQGTDIGTPPEGATLPGTAPAIGEYEDNQGLASDVDRSTASTLQQAAQDGDPAAQFQLGLSYLQSGQTEEGVKLIREAANKGQPAAQYRLAKLYESGEGVEADAAIARQFTERAARSGNRIAMHDLALYYAEGRGDVEVNIATAAQWFEQAAERGVVDSQFNLGVLYESGQGLPKNLSNAYVWYSIAAQQGDQFARQRIDILTEQLSEEDLNAAKARAESFKPTRIDEEANGIFRTAAWNANNSGAENAARNQIKEAQTLLNQLGFNTGNPDGSIGPRTRSAIVSFQKTQGLSETGEVDMALILELQRASGA